MKNIFLAIIIFSLCSCTDEKKTVLEWKDKELTGFVMKTGDNWIKGVYFQTIFDDNIIAIEPGGNQRFAAIQIKEDSLKKQTEFLSIGRGPHEMLIPMLRYIPAEKMFFIGDYYNGQNKILYINRDSLNNTLSWEKSKLPSDEWPQITEVTPISKGEFLAYPYTDKNSMFVYIKDSIQYLDFPHPEDDSNIDDIKIKNDAYIGKICKHPHRNRFLYFAQRNRFMFVFDFKDGKIDVVATPFDLKPKYTVKNDRSSTDASCYLGYNDIYITDKYIYVLMNDATYDDLRNKKLVDGVGSRYCKTVYKLDWDGNPVERLVLDNFFVSIGVDENDKFLYGYTDIYDDKGTPTVIRYEL